jgi:AmmeMemoRadiSam system protein B
VNSADDPPDNDATELSDTPFFEMDDDSSSGALAIVPLAKTIDDPIPALREVKAQMITLGEDDQPADSSAEGQGETVVLLEDPDGLAGKPAALSTWAYALATLFDGHRNARAVVATFNQKYNQSVEPEQALELQTELDKALFLLSTRFEKILKRHMQGYLESDLRPASHAGTAYPLEPAALRGTVHGFFSAPDGPGDLKQLAAEAIGKTETARAVLVPHIDLRVGGATYAHAYKELLCNSQAEILVVLGVAHQSLGSSIFYVSQKDFSTPLGVLKTHRELARSLQTVSDSDPAEAEMAHRMEHSVEFQAVMLSGLADVFKREIQIVPILCGSADQFIAEDANPLASDVFQKFTRHLRKELDATGKKWGVLCSVDLSHVGPEFGHSTMMTERLLPPVARADKQLLRHAEKLDAEGFMAEVARNQNSRHVDAIMAVLTMLKTCEGLLTSGRLLHYDQMFKKGTHSAVSYAAMVFE